MKIRNSFVSNSSSSSFVVIGTEFTPEMQSEFKNSLPAEKTQDDEWLYDDTISKKTDGLNVLYVGDQERIIGLVLADVGSDGDYLERRSYTPELLVEMVKKVSAKLGGVPVKLMLGTRPS